MNESNMAELNAATRVDEATARVPGAVDVFATLGIDYCCKGGQTLEEAARAKGMPLERLIGALRGGLGESAPAERDWSASTLTELADNIVSEHHAYLRRELPELDALAERVARVHGDHAPDLVRLRDVFASMRSELEMHMMKEEQILFPMIRDMEATGNTAFHCGSLENPVRVMEMEHDSAEGALEEMSRMTNGFRPPDDACSSWRRLFLALGRLEKDMKRHIHKENEILFPRALEREKAS